MISLDSITNENSEEHNEKWPFFPLHLYRTLIVESSGLGKTKALLNLIKEQDNIDKIYFHAKDLSETKYEFVIKKRNDAFMEYLNTIDDVYQNIDDYNPRRKRKILIVFDDMIADIMNKQKNLNHNQIIAYYMQKIKYFTYFYHSVLFFCSKRCEGKFNTLLDYENQQVLFFCSKRFEVKFNTLFDSENQQQKRITKYCN